jgi:hypothetical protein
VKVRVKFHKFVIPERIYQKSKLQGETPYHPKKQKNKNLKSKCHWWENPPPVKTYGFPIKDFGNDRKYYKRDKSPL